MIVANEAAARAALAGWYDTRTPDDYAPNLIASMTRALDAAIPHLTDAGQPLVTPADEIVGRLGALLLPHFDDLEKLLHQILAQPVAEVLTASTEPTDGELWRHALQLAAIRLGNDGSREELLELARWFYRVGSGMSHGQEETSSGPDGTGVAEVRDWLMAWVGAQPDVDSIHTPSDADHAFRFVLGTDDGERVIEVDLAVIPEDDPVVLTLDNSEGPYIPRGFRRECAECCADLSAGEKHADDCQLAI